MFKEFVSARLSLNTVNPATEKKTTISLNDLTENADPAEVASVRDALQNVIEDVIESTEGIVTYSFV